MQIDYSTSLWYFIFVAFSLSETETPSLNEKEDPYNNTNKQDLHGPTLKCNNNKELKGKSGHKEFKY